MSGGLRASFYPCALFPTPIFCKGDVHIQGIVQVNPRPYDDHASLDQNVPDWGQISAKKGDSYQFYPFYMLGGWQSSPMIDPEFQALFRQRVAQAALGARMNIDSVRLLRQDKREVTVDIYLGAVFWGNGTAVQIVMRNS